MQNTSEAVAALGKAFRGNSALLKHEVAYVLGQMLQAAAVPFLRCLGLLHCGSAAIHAAHTPVAHTLASQTLCTLVMLAVTHQAAPHAEGSRCPVGAGCSG